LNISLLLVVAVVATGAVAVAEQVVFVLALALR
jgi:hypothetical protein